MGFGRWVEVVVIYPESFFRCVIDFFHRKQWGNWPHLVQGWGTPRPNSSCTATPHWPHWARAGKPCLLVRKASEGMITERTGQKRRGKRLVVSLPLWNIVNKLGLLSPRYGKLGLLSLIYGKLRWLSPRYGRLGLSSPRYGKLGLLSQRYEKMWKCSKAPTKQMNIWLATLIKCWYKDLLTCTTNHGFGHMLPGSGTSLNGAIWNLLALLLLFETRKHLWVTSNLDLVSQRHTSSFASPIYTV